MVDDKTSLPETAMAAVQGKDLSGKVYLITGAYSGLGVATTKALLSAGGTVIVAGRNPTVQKEFCDNLVSQDGFMADKIDGSHQLDLSDLESVKSFAVYVKEKYPIIDVLICNAGVMNTPCGKTKQGFEIQMGVNGIGHFLLAKILAQQTKRQVWVSSRGHTIWKGGTAPQFDASKAPRIDIDAVEKVNDDEEETYDGWMRYQQSKLANILLSKQFKIVYNNMETVAIHPGLVQTNLFRHGNWFFMNLFLLLGNLGLVGKKPQTPQQGARTQTFLSVLPSEELTGTYYGYCKVEQEGPNAMEMEDAAALYEYCDKVTKDYQV